MLLVDVMTTTLSNPFPNGEKRLSLRFVTKSRRAGKEEVVRMNPCSDIHHNEGSTKSKTEVLSALDIVLFLSVPPSPPGKH